MFVSKMLVWKDEMLDMPIEQLKKIVNSPAYNRFVFVEHNWKQLKLTNAWYEKQCSLVSYDLETIMREIDLKRIHGSNQSPFSRAAIMYIMQQQATPIETIDYSKNLCEIHVYDKLYINKPYILVIDPAEGLGQDNNTFVVIDPITDLIVADFESPYITQPDLFKLVDRFMDDRCQSCMIVVENNRGRESINLFLESKWRDQLYYDESKLGSQVIEKTDPYGRLKHEASQRRAWGLSTSSNRNDYFAILENFMEERKEVIKSQRLVRDVCGLIRKVSGRVEAGTGQHDDILLAYLMGMFINKRESYEKLAQYGIYRGASDDYADYDESGKLSEEGAFKKLIEMAPSLPDNIRELIEHRMQYTDPVKEATKNISATQYIRNTLNASKEEVNPRNNKDYVLNNSPNNISFWENYDEQTLRSNEDDKYNYSPDFDIEDYL